MPLHTYDPCDDQVAEPDLLDLYESDAEILPALSLEEWLADAWWEDRDAQVDGDEMPEIPATAEELAEAPF